MVKIDNGADTQLSIISPPVGRRTTVMMSSRRQLNRNPVRVLVNLAAAGLFLIFYSAGHLVGQVNRGLRRRAN